MNRTTPTITELVSVIREYNIANQLRSQIACLANTDWQDDGFGYLQESAKIASNFLQATLRSYEITKEPNESSSPTAGGGSGGAQRNA